MTVQDLSRRMSAAEFAEWMAFDAHDPLPDRRQDWHFAALSALTLNIHATRPAGKKAWTAAEMRLFAKAWDPPETEADRRAAVAQSLLASLRGYRHPT